MLVPGVPRLDPGLLGGIHQAYGFPAGKDMVIGYDQVLGFFRQHYVFEEAASRARNIEGGDHYGDVHPVGEQKAEAVFVGVFVEAADHLRELVAQCLCRRGDHRGKGAGDAGDPQEARGSFPVGVQNGAGPFPFGVHGLHVPDQCERGGSEPNPSALRFQKFQAEFA
ncbi:hypothetical protein A6A29_19355 [Streptomyces sp. TSRI0281]|nr:hypothetical protein A6A29_19355 [Streptomyces sp. TSRI0281]